MTTQFPILKTEGDSKVHLLGENPEPHEDQQDFANLLEIPTTNETVDAVATNDDSGLLAEIDKTDINLLLAELESSGSIAASLGDFDLIADGIGSKLDNAVLDGSTQQIQQPQSIANLLNASGSLVGQFQTSGDRASIQLTASNQIESQVEADITGVADEIALTINEAALNHSPANDARNAGLTNQQLLSNEDSLVAAAPTATNATIAYQGNPEADSPTQEVTTQNTNIASLDATTGAQSDLNSDSQNQSSDFLQSNLQSTLLDDANSQSLNDGVFENALADVNQQNFSQSTEIIPNNIASINSTKLIQYQAFDGPDFSFSSIGENVRQVLSDSISNQTIDAIHNGVFKSDLQGTHSFEIEIHPVELGKLNIEVDVAADAIQARIIATENFSADLLSRNKAELLDALADFGYSETNVDISHQDSRNQHEEYESDFSESAPFDFSQPTDTPSSLVVRVGVDLVA